MIDEQVAIKAFSECMRKSLLTVSNQKRKLFWKEYLQLRSEIEQGILHETDMGEKLISLLVSIVGDSTHTFQSEITNAILNRKEYVDAFYQDWYDMFVTHGDQS